MLLFVAYKMKSVQFLLNSIDLRQTKVSHTISTIIKICSSQPTFSVHRTPVLFESRWQKYSTTISYWNLWMLTANQIALFFALKSFNLFSDIVLKMSANAHTASTVYCLVCRHWESRKNDFNQLPINTWNGMHWIVTEAGKNRTHRRK